MLLDFFSLLSILFLFTRIRIFLVVSIISSVSFYFIIRLLISRSEKFHFAQRGLARTNCLRATHLQLVFIGFSKKPYSPMIRYSFRQSIVSYAALKSMMMWCVETWYLRLFWKICRKTKMWSVSERQTWSRPHNFRQIGSLPKNI